MRGFKFLLVLLTSTTIACGSSGGTNSSGSRQVGRRPPETDLGRCQRKGRSPAEAQSGQPDLGKRHFLVSSKAEEAGRFAPGLLFSAAS